MEHTERPRRARHRRVDDPPDGGIDLDLDIGHGHGHGHGPAPPAGRRIRILIACLLVPAVIATVAGLVLLFPRAERPTGAAASPRVDGHVTTARETACDAGQEPTGCVALTIELTDGPLPGHEIVVVVSKVRGNAPFGAGDDVVLVRSGDDPADPASYDVTDFQRDTPIQLLAVLFAIAVVTLGRWRGLAALVALGFTGVVLIGFVLPAILDGRDPLLVAIVGSCAIMFGVLYLTHGFSARTSTAVLGTLLSLVLIGVLGAAFAAAARLTGDGEDTASLAAALGTSVDGRGLVLAGLVIGALGALDDVTVTQTSAVWELRRANPQLRPAALFGAAMRIGRDHVASAVNTLVLAYAGAALPLLLLYSVAERGLGETLTAQVIATEVVRTLVGSIGIVASVPITTLLAVAVVSRDRSSTT
ncbi:YibE/F family protein [Actinomycetes bacterium KLBMP 9759]